jgi:protein-glucosylgalactosylhydroxylysine glucosidase
MLSAQRPATNVFVVFLFMVALSCARERSGDAPIDRYALVHRHNVVLNQPDTLGALSVGNGEFAFTVDVSGLQTFYKEYEHGIPLGTQAQWAWHSIPQSKAYGLKDVARSYASCDGTEAPYAVQHGDGEAGAATEALRANPHRLHLGLVGLVLLREDGTEARLEDLKHIHQQLDLWTGEIESTYEIEGVPVRVRLYAHPQQDGIAVRIESPLIEKKRLKVKFDFPYGKDCHVCPGYEWRMPDRHSTEVLRQTTHSAVLKRKLDSTTYVVRLDWRDEAVLESSFVPHHFELRPSGEAFEFTTLFQRGEGAMAPGFDTTARESAKHWEAFWSDGGAIDFSACTDARAPELERRVVLSQYLTRIQCAGSLPPQETGLTMNSWYGKFHLEMYWWHAAHFALWGRPELMERSMRWFTQIQPKAEATARWQGYAGARWPKMTDPYGNESPSNIGAFIIWQQPHPIYLAELLYRADSSHATLEKYKDMVFGTADFMASFLRKRDGVYHLCHPLIPAQEVFKAEETDDPAYELEYWYYGLQTAQTWRLRLGLAENESWNDMLQHLAPLSMGDGLYLPNATTPGAYAGDAYRRDHPAVLGALGFLPASPRVDTAIMHDTMNEIIQRWQWPTTWGWDYPLVAMTAARLGDPTQAVNALLLDAQKNTYLMNGHNYQDNRLRLYLPGNGGLLAAVAMMARGWDGCGRSTPGFPDNGKWKVRWEGLEPMP